MRPTWKVVDTNQDRAPRLPRFGSSVDRCKALPTCVSIETPVGEFLVSTACNSETQEPGCATTSTDEEIATSQKDGCVDCRASWPMADCLAPYTASDPEMGGIPLNEE
jgi:hypothetical protein